MAPPLRDAGACDARRRALFPEITVVVSGAATSAAAVVPAELLRVQRLGLDRAGPGFRPPCRMEIIRSSACPPCTSPRPHAPPSPGLLGPDHGQRVCLAGPGAKVAPQEVCLPEAWAPLGGLFLSGLCTPRGFVIFLPVHPLRPCFSLVLAASVLVSLWLIRPLGT